MTRKDLLAERALLITRRKQLLAEEAKHNGTRAYDANNPFGNWKEIRNIESQLLYNTELLKLPIYSA